jgi:hypothetical protein
MFVTTQLNKPSLWPTVPDDATLASVIESARRYTGTSVNAAARRFLGLNQFQGDLFASCAGTFARRMPGEPVAPETIVLRHTPFRLYASFLTLQDEARWLSAIVDRDLATLRALTPPTKVGRLQVRELRQCRDCTQEDVRRFGVGHWHVAHQIPSMRRCPWHRCELHDRCAECGARLGGGRTLTMPGDSCRSCASIETASTTHHSASPGYVAMEALVMRSLAGSAPELRPSARVALVDRVIHRRVGTRGLPEVVKRFLTTWSVETPLSLGERLGCVATESKLLGLFGGVETATARTLQAAAISFALEHATAGDQATSRAAATIHYSPEDLFFQEGVTEPDPELLRAFCSGAVTFGYPIEGARSLAAGAKPRFLAEKGLAAPNVTRRFVSRFSDEIQNRYGDMVNARSERRSAMQRAESEARPVARKRILSALKAGATTRTKLDAACQGALIWALRHDSDWLETVVPKRAAGRRRRWLESDRPFDRALISETINNGVETRRELKAANESLYRWALKNDREWLDSKLPVLRRARTGRLNCLASILLRT